MAGVQPTDTNAQDDDGASISLVPDTQPPLECLDGMIGTPLRPELTCLDWEGNISQSSGHPGCKVVDLKTDNTKYLHFRQVKYPKPAPPNGDVVLVAAVPDTAKSRNCLLFPFPGSAPRSLPKCAQAAAQICTGAGLRNRS